MLYVNRLSIEDSGGDPEGDVKGIDCLTIEDNVRQNMKEVPIDEYEIEEIEYLDLEILKQELKKGRLRQGWGLALNGLNMDLRNSYFNDKKMRWEPEDKWVEDTIELHRLVWDVKIKCSQAVGRFRIISKLLEMKPGDIIFIPKIPNDDMFTVATVESGYDFAQIGRYVGHGHIIRVKNIAEYRYDDTISAMKLARHGRRAVNRIRKEKEFIKYLTRNKYLSNVDEPLL